MVTKLIAMEIDASMPFTPSMAASAGEDMVDALGTVRTVCTDQDLLRTFFQYLDLKDLCSAACVSCMWREVANCEDFWREISFKHVAVSPQQVCALLSRHRHVKTLDLSGLTGGLSNPQLFHKLTKGLQHLQHLSYTSPQPPNNLMASPVLDHISKCLPALKCLDLNGVLMQTGLAESSVLAHRGLEDITLTVAGSPTVTLRCCNLRRLSLAYSSQLQRLPNLQGCSSLLHLNAHGCKKLSDSSVRATLPMLMGLQVLQLGGGVPVSEDTVRDMASTLTVLTSLVLSGTANLSLTGLRDMPRLRHLDVSACESLTANSLQEAAESCQQLEVLLLDGCIGLTTLKLNMGCLQEISLQRCSGLTELELNCRRLQKLALGANNSNLVCLSLSSDVMAHMEWVQCRKLSQISLDCPQLAELTIRDCDNISPSVLQSLGDRTAAKRKTRMEQEQQAAAPSLLSSLRASGNAPVAAAVARCSHARTGAMQAAAPAAQAAAQTAAAEAFNVAIAEAAQLAAGSVYGQQHAVAQVANDHDGMGPSGPSNTLTSTALTAFATGAATLASMAAGPSSSGSSGVRTGRSGFAQCLLLQQQQRQRQQQDMVPVPSTFRNSSNTTPAVPAAPSFWFGISSGHAMRSLSSDMPDIGALDAGPADELEQQVAAAAAVGYAGVPELQQAEQACMQFGLSAEPAAAAAAGPDASAPMHCGFSIFSTGSTPIEPGAAPQPAPQQQLQLPTERLNGSGGVPRLHVLRVEGCDGLQRLQLSHSGLQVLGVSGCQTMSELVLHAPSLTGLDLEEVGDLETISLQQVALPALSLGGCSGLAGLAVSSRCLASLDLRGCGQLKQLCLDCPGLLGINATFCSGLDDEGLLGAVAAAPQLTQLVLSVCCQVGSRGLTALSRIPNLHVLDLSYTEVTDLLPVFSSCSHLQTLSISSCRGLQPNTLQPLLLARGAALPLLTSLDASYCEMPEEVVLQLVAMCRQQLTHLALNGCAGVTCQMWKHLEALQQQQMASRRVERQQQRQQHDCASQHPVNSNPYATCADASSLMQVDNGSEHQWGLDADAGATGASGSNRHNDTSSSSLGSLSLVRCSNLKSLCLGLLPASGDIEVLSPKHYLLSAGRAGLHGAQMPVQWVEIPSALQGLTSLKAGLSGVQVLALSLPHLAHLDLSGCVHLRVLELRCPLLLTLLLQSCRAVPIHNIAQAVAGSSELQKLDVQHVPCSRHPAGTVSCVATVHTTGAKSAEPDYYAAAQPAGLWQQYGPSLRQVLTCPEGCKVCYRVHM